MDAMDHLVGESGYMDRIGWDDDDDDNAKPRHAVVVVVVAT
jgi:hypothetical protein